MSFFKSIAPFVGDILGATLGALKSERMWFIEV